MGMEFLRQQVESFESKAGQHSFVGGATVSYEVPGITKQWSIY